MDGKPRWTSASVIVIAVVGSMFAGGSAAAQPTPPQVGRAYSRGTPIEGAVAESSKRAGRTLSITRVVALAGATVTASTTQPPAGQLLNGAHLSVLRCNLERGVPAGCRTVLTRSYPVLPGDFVIDPLLRSAVLDVGRGKTRLRVQWTGVGDVATSTKRWTRGGHGDPTTGDLWWEAEGEARVEVTRAARAVAELGSRRVHLNARGESWILRSGGAYGAHSACLAEALAPC